MNEVQILTFLSLPGVGKITVKKIIDKKINTSIYNELDGFIHALDKVSPSIAAKLNQNDVQLSNSKAEKIIEQCKLLNITVIGYNNDIYPGQLKSLEKKAPVLLFAKGDLSVLKHQKNVAIIGSRDISNEGIKAGKYITQEFVNRGFNVVSGLAKGCDTVGHQICLDNGGKTIAVLASGVDVIYPKENEDLSKQILDNGCLISEYPPNTDVMSNYFVERDRIQSGLSQAVVVIETNVKGGTIHTVNFAINQKRKVACIKYKDDLILPTNAGNRMLIDEKKAFALTSKNIEQFITSFEEFRSTNMGDQGKLNF